MLQQIPDITSPRLESGVPVSFYKNARVVNNIERYAIVTHSRDASVSTSLKRVSFITLGSCPADPPFYAATCANAQDL